MVSAKAHNDVEGTSLTIFFLGRPKNDSYQCHERAPHREARNQLRPITPKIVRAEWLIVLLQTFPLVNLEID